MTFVTVYCASNDIEANLVRNLLKENNIKTNIKAELPSTVYGFAVQGMEVQVDADEEEWALRLIEAYFSEDAEIVDHSENPYSD